MTNQTKKYKFVCLDGKTARSSFDIFNNQKAKHILYAFSRDDQLILAHEEVTKDKTNEIPKAQEMIDSLELNTKNVVFTADAMNCQIGTIKSIVTQASLI